jgi:hypothetical protein
LRIGIRQPPVLRHAHVARNALVHSAGRVSRQPPEGCPWRLGDSIRLCVDDVHQFGIAARDYARQLCDRVLTLCDGGQNAEPLYGL